VTILILTDYYPPDRIGGVGTIAHGLAEAYRALGHRVVVLTTGASNGERDVIRGTRGLLRGVLTNNVRAWRLIRRERVSLVHLHQSGTTLFLLARRLMRRFPFVLDSLQVDYVSEAREIRTHVVHRRRIAPGIREFVEKFVLAPGHIVLDFIGFAMSDAVTTVSRDNKIEIDNAYGRLAPRPVAVVPNGMSAPAGVGSSFSDPALEERLRGKTVIAHIGVFRARKRVANLLLSFAEIASRCPDARLLLVGGGRGYEEALKDLSRELGILDRVEFAGSVSPARVPYYLSLVDIFCLLSSYEGMPMALLEAMQSGKAVIATDAYGMRDVLAGSDAGILVPVDDVPATARAIESLVRDPVRREAMGTAARALVQTRYTWERIARQYLALADVPHA
jgi:glycosyltransferase involved in cell wall biosynthesis